MREIYKYILMSIGCFIITYLLFSFASVNMDFEEWSKEERVACVLTFLVFYVIMLVVYYDKKY